MRQNYSLRALLKEIYGGRPLWGMLNAVLERILAILRDERERKI